MTIVRESVAWLIFFCTSPLWMPFVVSTLLRYRVRKSRPAFVIWRARRLLRRRRRKRQSRTPSA